jgi:hypothetical protein
LIFLYSYIVTAFNSLNASVVAGQLRDPTRLLKPPRGRFGSKTSQQFTHTAPVFDAFAKRNALEMSRAQMLAAKP